MAQSAHRAAAASLLCNFHNEELFILFNLNFRTFLSLALKLMALFVLSICWYTVFVCFLAPWARWRVLKWSLSSSSSSTRSLSNFISPHQTRKYHLLLLERLLPLLLWTCSNYERTFLIFRACSSLDFSHCNSNRRGNMFESTISL